MQEGLALSTRKSYSSAQHKFCDFCFTSQRLNSSGSPYPTDEWTLCLFATFLAESLRHSSIKVYLSAVRSLHIEHGFADPLTNCLQLQRVLHGIKRTQGMLGARHRLPVTVEIMQLVHSSLNLECYSDRMFWAACTLAYFGFLRSSEFTVPSLAVFDHNTHLSVVDIVVDSRDHPTFLQVNIKASKTDPFRQGCSIYIGKVSTSLCAIKAMMNYLALRGNSPGSLFLLESGHPLSRELVTSRLRMITKMAGLDGNFSSPSFRIGAATMAARSGIPDHLIQVLGRWRSDAYKQYIQTPREAITKASQNWLDMASTCILQLA